MSLKQAFPVIREILSNSDEVLCCSTGQLQLAALCCAATRERHAGCRYNQGVPKELL